jgi:hypothetical protein
LRALLKLLLSQEGESGMAKQTVQSGLAARLGEAGRKAVENHAADEVRYSGAGDLPTGINNGIAQLCDCYFDQYKKGDNLGKDYFYAAGIVKQPTLHDGVPVAGLRTSIMEPMCQTKKKDGTIVTIDDHVDNVLNYFRQLGVDTKGFKLEMLEQTAAALEKAKPHFRFRTWGGPTKDYPNGRVNHDWRGACEYNEGGDEGIVDNTEPEEPLDDPQEPEASSVEELDYAALGEAADHDDKQAQATLANAAKEAGIDPESIATWSEVAEALSSEAPEEESEGDEPEAEAYTPEKEDMVTYKAPGKKKAVECEVTAVFAGKELVNLKDPNGKSYKGVPWSKIEPVT